MSGPLEIGGAPLTLPTLEAALLPDVALFVGSDERPLQSLAGLIDFRLCGALTRQLKGELLTGAKGERTLTVAGNKLSAGRLFVFGVGPLEALELRGLGELFRDGFSVVRRAGGAEVSTSLPGFGRLPTEPLVTAAVEAALGAGLARLRLHVPSPRELDACLHACAERDDRVALVGTTARVLREPSSVLR